MFKKTQALSDAEFRSAFEQLAAQVDSLQKVMVATIGLLLATAGEWDKPPEDVHRAMIETLAVYAQEVIAVQDHLEQMYEQYVTRSN